MKSNNIVFTRLQFHLISQKCLSLTFGNFPRHGIHLQIYFLSFTSRLLALRLEEAKRLMFGISNSNAFREAILFIYSFSYLLFWSLNPFMRSFYPLVLPFRFCIRQFLHLGFVKSWQRIIHAHAKDTFKHVSLDTDFP